MIRRLVAAAAALPLALVATPAAGAIPPQEPAAARAVAVPASVSIPAASEVYLVGDSITSMPNSWAYRWRERICGTETTCLPHVHVGTAGGTGGCLLATCNGHPPLVTEWDTAVLQANPKPTTVIVEIGTNDFYNPGGVTAGQMSEGYKHLVFSGINAGIRVIIATIPPTTTSWSAHNAHNPLRRSINGWIRSYFGASNVFDIDSGLRIGTSGDADPYYYSLPGNAGDGLHPSPWGAVCIASWLAPARIV